MPKVSICIPTYNQADYIKECIDSALAQSMDDLEVVVSDNHSTDRTPEILRQYQDSRLRIVRPERFLEMGDNYAFCIAESSGEYFCILSSDDVLMPEMVQRHTKTLDDNPEVVFSYAATELIDENGVTKSLAKSIHPSFIRSGFEELKRSLYGVIAFLPSALIRRSAFEKIGGFSHCKMVGDWDLFLRLFQVGDVAYDENVLCKYRDYLDPEGRRRARLPVMMQEIVDLYDRIIEPLSVKYPELKNHVKTARRRYALGLRFAFIENPPYRQSIREAMLALSPSWQVRTSLLICAHPLGGNVVLWTSHVKNRLKPVIKSLLYKFLSSTR